jgi:hypothetical protein
MTRHGSRKGRKTRKRERRRTSDEGIAPAQEDSEGCTGLHKIEAVRVQEIGYVGTGMGLYNTAIGS